MVARFSVVLELASVIGLIPISSLSRGGVSIDRWIEERQETFVAGDFVRSFIVSN